MIFKLSNFQFLITICFVYFYSTTASAQKKWTFKDCINFAIENNIGLQQQELIVKSSEISLNTAKLSRLPNFAITTDQSFSFNKEAGNSSMTSVGLNSSLPLFAGFKIINQIKVEQYNLSANKESLKKHQEILELEVLTYYLDILLKSEILKINQEQENLTKEHLKNTALLVQSGKKLASDIYDVEAQLASDQLNIVIAETDLEMSTLNLAQLLNIEDKSNFGIIYYDVSNDIINHINMSLTANTIFEIAKMIKPQIKESEDRLKSSQSSVSLAKGDYYPSINLNFGYQTFITNKKGVYNDNFKTQLQNNGSELISLTLNIPIFNRFETRNKVKQAKISVADSQLQLQEIKRILYKEVEQSFYKVRTAKAKLLSAEKKWFASQEAYRYMQARFNIGKATIYELNDSKSKLKTSSIEQTQAKYELLFSLKVIDFYCGKDLDF